MQSPDQQLHQYGTQPEDMTGRRVLPDIKPAIAWPAGIVGAGALVWGASQVFEDVPQFEQPLLAGTAALIALGTAAVAKEQHTTFQSMSEEGVFADPDQSEQVARAVKTQRRAWFAGTLLVGASLTGLALDAADPYTEKSRSSVEDVAVIVDASAASYAQDVIGPDGAIIERINANTNAFKYANLPKGIELTFIAAGAEPQGMGTVDSEGNGRNEMIERFTNYTNIPRYAQSADIQGALSDSAVQEADKVIILTGSTENVPVSAFKGEAIKDSRRISIVAVGTTGSTSEYAGKVVDAPINEAANIKRVGQEDSYVASSVNDSDGKDGLKSIINDIVRTQYTVTEKKPFNGFERLRDGAAALLTVGLGIGFAVGSIRRKSSRKGI